MNITKAGTEHYIPAYTRTNLTDDLHKMGGFQTDYQILTESMMKKICKKSRKEKLNYSLFELKKTEILAYLSHSRSFNRQAWEFNALFKMEIGIFSDINKFLLKLYINIP